ncbi:hypothetical protein FGE12_17155 [Aggregicoccus sp. 17bor-14]|nr:hypothetical protein [Simulacricoccus sp. 17bor-14]MRI89880.1 hypothetical protein [Aggregicoccus sp. 17bor-14]
MRKLTTRSLELYYPAAQRAAALRVAARLEGCVDQLRGHARDKRERKRVLAYLTRADFNNAYVQPEVASLPQQMVLPEHVTIELFHYFNLGLGQVGDISCHESVHYVQMQQVSGLWNALNTVTGGLLQPNIFTESWFLEGLATHYEGRLGARTGRPHSPFWNGWFEDNVQTYAGSLHAGDLAVEQRRLSPLGSAYLTGQHFVDWLADTYGEEKLWKLVEVQGDSIFSPFGVTLRFKQVYGRDVGSLFDQYAQSLRKGLHPRERPATQQVLAGDVGYQARLAGSPADGALALLHSGREQPLRLTVREPDGRVRFSRSLVELLPGRRWVSASVSGASGMSFSADGASLFLVMTDVGREGSDVSRLWQVDAHTGAVKRIWDGLQGLGGSVTPDGRAYVFAQVQGDTTNLFRLELATGAREQLTHLEARSSLGAPAVSPDGRRIVVSRWASNGFDLALLEPDGRLRDLTHDGLFNYSPRWVDDAHVAFLREHEGRAQVHVLDVDAGTLTRVTDAPHLALDASPLPGGQLAFLNLSGGTFSVDRVALAGGVAAAPSAGAQAEPGTVTAAAAPAQLPEAVARAQATGSLQAPDVAASSSDAPTVPPSAQAPGASAQEAAPVATQAPTTVAAAAETPAAGGPTVLSDEPYSPGEGLLIPLLRLPFILGIESDPQGGTRVLGGVSLTGQDRLGFHGYAVNAIFGGGTALRALSVVYNNAQLAPWNLRLVGYGERSERTLRVRVPGEEDRFVYQWVNRIEGVASASRSFWSTPVVFGLRAVQKRFQRTAFAADARDGLVGAEAATSWFAGESTAYGGTQRGLALALSGGAYQSNDSQQVGDVRAETDGFLGGLPGLRRDNLVLRLVGRTLPGASAGLLEVGGTGAYNAVGNLEDSARGNPGRPLPETSFVEPLRGYEDLTIFARNVALASASYRYRFIIDHGWASFLYLLPSFFVRQAELNLFAEMARTDLRDNHRSAGAAVYLRTSFGGVAPVSLVYQVSKRFDDDHAVRHFFGLGVE